MKRLVRLAASAAVIALGFTGSAYSQIDVVFKIDESGSMNDQITDVQANVVTIFNALPAGAAVGLVGYGATTHGSGQAPHIHTALTSDQVVFQNAVNGLVANGGFEPGYQAVYEAATDTVAGGSLGFTGAPYCNILITDETPAQGARTRQEAIDAMNAVNGIFFGILPANLFAEAQPLADATGGQLFDLAQFQQDATPVINAVLAACVAAAVPVDIDIKPKSCPNPHKLNNNGRGVIPVAILGSEDFDVTRIKPETVTLEGDCPALRSSVEDVSTPFDGDFNDPPMEDQCNAAGSDGWPDLVVHFDRQCVNMTQAPVSGSEARLWSVKGTYVNDNGDEVEFEASDVVRVME